MNAADEVDISGQLIGIFQVMESIRANREALRNYRQTGWWTGSASSVIPTATVDENVKPMTARRSFQK